MANSNTPFGFSQYSGTGSAPTYEQVRVTVAYNAPAIYYGDPVTPLSDGTVARSVDTTSSQVQIAGIFVGCKYLSVSQKRTVWSNYWPGTDVANTNSVTGYIINDPNAKFLVQSDATGIASTDINSNIGFAIGNGNTASGISGAYLDYATLSTPGGTANTNPFRVVDLVVDPPGAPGTAAGAYNRVIVAFNNVSTKTLTSVG